MTHSPIKKFSNQNCQCPGWSAFECDVNQLPLSLMVSWFEQKAVAVLLSLLSSGIRSIHLGSTLPAFLTPNLLAVLVEKFDIKANGEPAADLAGALKQAA